MPFNGGTIAVDQMVSIVYHEMWWSSTEAEEDTPDQSQTTNARFANAVAIFAAPVHTVVIVV